VNIFSDKVRHALFAIRRRYVTGIDIVPRGVIFNECNEME
jgi:hypothetical protein